MCVFSIDVHYFKFTSDFLYFSNSLLTLVPKLDTSFRSKEQYLAGDLKIVLFRLDLLHRKEFVSSYSF